MIQEHHQKDIFCFRKSKAYGLGSVLLGIAVQGLSAADVQADSVTVSLERSSITATVITPEATSSTSAFAIEETEVSEPVLPVLPVEAVMPPEMLVSDSQEMAELSSTDELSPVTDPSIQNSLAPVALEEAFDSLEEVIPESYAASTQVTNLHPASVTGVTIEQGEAGTYRLNGMVTRVKYNAKSTLVSVGKKGTYVINYVDTGIRPEAAVAHEPVLPTVPSGLMMTPTVTADGQVYWINQQKTTVPYVSHQSPLLTVSPKGTYLINYVDTGVLAAGGAISVSPEPHRLPLADVSQAQVTSSDTGVYRLNGQLTQVRVTSQTPLVMISPKGTYLINYVDTGIVAEGAISTPVPSGVQSAGLEAELAKRYLETDFSERTWAVYVTARNAAQAVLAQTSMTQAEVDQALAVLRAAITNLGVDKTALESEVAEADAYLADDYSRASWGAYQAELTKATSLLRDQLAKQSAINAQTTRLDAAQKALTVDQTLLLAEVEAASALATDRYSRTSWQAFESALTAARQVLHASPMKQSELDRHTDLLKKAVRELVPLQAAPLLRLEELTTDAMSKTVDLTYKWSNPDQVSTVGTVRLYQGQQLIEEKLLTEDHLRFDSLSYDQPYRIVTTLTYNIGQGDVTKTLEDQDFTLKLKKIEIKDIDRLSLEQVSEGNTRLINRLSEQPQDLSSYFVRVQSDRFRDMLLPVTAIEESEQDGEAVYRVTASVPELVQDQDTTSQSLYQDGFTFYVPKASQAEEPHVYTTFESLLTAMKANSDGNFIIGADLFANEMVLDRSQPAYVMEKFTGTLTGKHGEKSYAIYGLSQPLFASVAGQIQHLDLRDVAIVSPSDRVGALAKETTGTATISDVAVTGSVIGQRTVAGVIGHSSGSILDNISFEGKVSSRNTASNGDNFVGGLVGRMENGSLTRGYVNADVSAYAYNNVHKVSAVVGSYYASKPGRLSKLYAKGTVTNLSTSANGASGLVGSIWQRGQLSEAITEVKVVGGGSYINSDTNHTGAAVDTNTVFAVQEMAVAPVTERWTRFISTDQAKEKLASYGITATTKDTDNRLYNHQTTTDYTGLVGAQENRLKAYLNVEKLLPFYNKEVIVDYGNRLDSQHHLATKTVVSVTPMIDHRVVSDIHTHKTQLNRLMVYYDDKTVDYLPLRYLSDFKNTAISEYAVDDLDLIFTPEQFLSAYDSILARVLPALETVTYKSEAMATAIGAYTPKEVIDKVATGQTQEAATASLVNDRMRDLYLEQQFDRIKADLPTYLRQILATDAAINTTGGAVDDHLVDYILDHKEKLLIGLSYVTRWYNIQFDALNIQSLVAFNQDFYGKPVKTLDWLISIGEAGYQLLKLKNNLGAYTALMSLNTGSVSLFDDLDSKRRLFAADKTPNEWFKSATTAYIGEAHSAETDRFETDTYDKMTRRGSVFNDMVLPLLTAEEGLYAITSVNSIHFGMFDRYMDMSLKTSNPERYRQERDRVKRMIDEATEWQKDHFDFYYRMVLPEYRDKLERDVTSWDGYAVGGWRNANTATQAMKDFFLPIERYYGDNGAGAYANGSGVFFVRNSLLTRYGSSVYTHEMVHNNDGRIYFNGGGRRNNLGAEYFALGLLQAPSDPTKSGFGINTIFDFSADKDNPKRSHNISPKQFRTDEDLRGYMSGVFDVIYLLDYAEADVILSKDPSTYKNYLLQVQTVMEGNYPANRRVALPEGLVLRSVDDLVDNELLSSRYRIGNTDSYGIKANGYYEAGMMDPIYAVGENPNGTAGDLLFRRMAFEMLAYKGYTNGFVPYVSNALKTKATEAGLSVLTDDFVISQVSGGEYQTMKAFKKAQLAARYAKATTVGLKPITITWRNQSLTITSYEQIKDLIHQAYALNAAQVTDLKQRIYSAYLRSTDDFRQSIYLGE